MELCNAIFRDRIVAQCLDALVAEGFTRYRKHDVDWPLHSGFHGWVGLNEGLHADRLNINPFVGIHVVPLEKLISTLEEKKYPGRYGRYATYAIHMGELGAAKEAARFSFTPEQSESFIADEVARLACLYATAGIDYARSIASYEALLPLFEGRQDMLGGYPERITSCLYLLGQKTEAKKFAESFLKKERNYFEGFALPFLELLDQED